jgi:hypothetical protein
MTGSRLPLPSIVLLALTTSLPVVVDAQGAFLKTLQALDNEARGFCLDLPGAPPNMNFDRPVLSHS